MTASQAFLGFDDLDSFEKYWLGILYNIPEFGFVRDVSLMIRMGLWVFQRKTTEVTDILITSYQAHTISLTYYCLLTLIMWLR